jgi:hypothetical protein
MYAVIWKQKMYDSVMDLGAVFVVARFKASDVKTSNDWKNLPPSQWYEQGVQAENGLSTLFLWDELSENRVAFVGKNYTQAFEIFSKLDTHGASIAALGELYQHGFGVARDKKKVGLILCPFSGLCCEHIACSLSRSSTLFALFRFFMFVWK